MLTFFACRFSLAFFPACFQFPRNRKTIAQAIYAFSISHCVFGFSWQTNKQTNGQRRRRRQQLPSFPARGNGRIFSTMPASNRQLPLPLLTSSICDKACACGGWPGPMPYQCQATLNTCQKGCLLFHTSVRCAAYAAYVQCARLSLEFGV